MSWVHGFIEAPEGGREIILCYAPDVVCADDTCSSWNAPPKHTLLHEYAHAWLDENVTQSTQAQFLDHAGLDRWSDWSDPWGERGMERAAQTIAFGLADTRRRVSRTTPRLEIRRASAC